MVTGAEPVAGWLAPGATEPELRTRQAAVPCEAVAEVWCTSSLSQQSVHKLYSLHWQCGLKQQCVRRQVRTTLGPELAKACSEQQINQFLRATSHQPAQVLGMPRPLFLLQRPALSGQSLATTPARVCF